ncbi:MAG: hypothetical protein HY341_01150 [Candidatus Kerfeldbacteria bacterium]|nr:hypothetical protein [Candidatus Kerfeldbacteria bacterium]
MRRLIFPILLIGASMIQMSFMSATSLTRTSVHLLLVVGTYVMLGHSYERALLWVVGGGLLLDTESVAPYGTETVSMAIAVMVGYIVYRRYFTNKSVATLIVLSLVASVTYILVGTAVRMTASALDPAAVPVPFGPQELVRWASFLLANTVAAVLLSFVVSRWYRPLALQRSLLSGVRRP